MNSTDGVNASALALNDDLRAQVSSLQSSIASSKNAATADSEEKQAKIDQLKMGKLGALFARKDGI